MPLMRAKCLMDVEIKGKNASDWSEMRANAENRGKNASDAS